MGNRETKDTPELQIVNPPPPEPPPELRVPLQVQLSVQLSVEVPSSVMTQEERLRADYQQALKLGEVLVAYARVMMIGAGGVGKSSFLRGLMNEKLPPNAESTIFADTKTVKPQFWAKAGESTDSYWVEVTEEDEIKELAGLVQLVAQGKSGSTSSHAAKVLSTTAAAVAVGMFKPLGFIPHRNLTMHDQNVSSIKDDVQNVFEKVLEYTQSNQGNSTVPKSEVLMHVWDCGGQPVFLDVLPAFLTSRTMFLLFFDARQDLHDLCSSLSYKKGRVVSKSEQNFTTLQLLTQWMASIHAMLTRKVSAIPFTTQPESENPATKKKETHSFDSVGGKKGQQSSATNQQNVEANIILNFPRIIPVGTHGDAIIALKQKEILRTLLSQCEGKAYTRLLQGSIIVDNTTAGDGKDDEDKGFNYIRKQVHQLASKHLAVRTPVAWVLFRKVLQKVAKGSPIVSYEQAVAVGQACGITEDVVPSVLHFYHELAVFLHYTQIESLSMCIFADPQWLIKQLGRLLAPEGLEEDVFKDLLWKPLREMGILVPSLYQAVWEESILGPKPLADLLEHFLLAAPIDPPESIIPHEGPKYLVPSVLKLSAENADSTPKSQAIVKISSPLHLTFSTHYVPPGFFTRLATSLTSEPNCRPLFERGIFRNRITFAYGEVDKIDEFTIFEHSLSVQITIIRTEHRKPHIPMFGTVCRDILKLIQVCSATVHQWFPSIKVEETFLCEQCLDMHHFIHIPDCAITDTLLRCSAGHNCYLNKQQQYWLKIPNTPQSLAEKGGLKDIELQGVADDVQKAGKLDDLADELETVPMLKELEGDANAPFKLLQRWCLGLKNSSEAHSLLVHHLKCIKLTQTSGKLHFREFLLQERLSVNQIALCSRHVYGDLTLLAAALGISDEVTLKSKHEKTRDQALQMLTQWQSSRTHTKQELTEILHNTGFKRAASMLASFPTTQQNDDSILNGPDTVLLKTDRAHDKANIGDQATLQQQPASSLPTTSTQLDFTSPRIETGAAAIPHAIVQALSTSSTVHTLDEPSLKDILESISSVAADWFNLGVALGLSYDTLKTIESNYPRDAPRCLTEMIIAWLQNSSQPTWRGLFLALMSPLVNRVDIANTIATQHLHLCT